MISPTYRRRTTSALIGAPAVVALLTLAACGGSEDGSSDSDLPTVDIAISTTSIASSAPFAVAEEEGYFEDAGCQIGELLSAAGGGATTLRAVLDGGLDMGEVATNSVIDGYLSGTPVKAVGSAHQMPYDFLFAVQPDSGIESIQDMEGKRWGSGSPGSATEALTYLLPEAAGLPSDSFERVPTGGLGEGLALLESGDIDAALIVPTVQARDPEKFDVGFEALDVIEAYQKTVYITTGAFAEENPEAVRCVLEGLNRASDFIKNDPAAAAELYAESAEDFTVEELTAELELAVEKGAFEGGVGFNPDGLANVGRALQLQGDVQEIPWEEIFDPAFLPDGVETAIPEAGS